MLKTVCMYLCMYLCVYVCVYASANENLYSNIQFSFHCVCCRLLWVLDVFVVGCCGC